MRARAPLDVDLEDKLLYGLTPIRLGYLLLALLAGMAIWNAAWLPTALRATGCLLIMGVGAAAAWGRWRGRATDEWLTDIAHFVIRNHRVVVDPRAMAVLRHRIARLRFPQ
jgi:hypothetical protein